MCVGERFPRCNARVKKEERIGHCKDREKIRRGGENLATWRGKRIEVAETEVMEARRGVRILEDD